MKCKICGEKFAGEKKLQTHTCRIHVNNPSKNSLYMKNWYVSSECIRVFCDEKKKEVAILHAHGCSEKTLFTIFIYARVDFGVAQ